MEPLGDIECMALERIHKYYEKSNRDFKFSIAVLGLYSFNIKSYIRFSSSDPDNRKMKHIKMRGQSHHRNRPGCLKKSRFTVGSGYDNFIKISTEGFDLGWTWRG